MKTAEIKFDFAMTEPDISPARREFPSKLFVEPTTRCNLRCRMCVKQSREKSIFEGDLSLELFKALVPAFAHLNALILTGIGEPLLHPHLEQFIAFTKNHLPGQSWVGIQTNGLLLTKPRVMSLLAAGLDKICISVDATSPEIFRSIRSGGEIACIERAFEALSAARFSLKNDRFKIGVEFVLMQNNLAELPRALSWSANRGANFAIVTHMLAYDDRLESHVIYNPNTDASRNIYRFWQTKAQKLGVDIARYFTVRWKHKKTPADQKIITLVEQMITDAYLKDIWLHLSNLMEEDESRTEKVAEIFTEAEHIAKSTGLELKLPALRPQKERKCNFIEDGSVFVTWQGNIHPCYFLWHRYVCYINANKKYIEPISFGDLSKQGILDIWNDPSYITMRENVLRYDYPYCGNCNIGPCDLIYSETFEQDCYGIEVPCGDCPWCMGLLHCLQ